MSNVIEKIKNWFKKLVVDVDATQPPRYYYKFNTEGDIEKVPEVQKLEPLKEEELINRWFNSSDLSALTKSELVKLCKDRSITVSKKDTKASLIKKLQ